MTTPNLLRPATMEEMIINSRIFGDCNHRDWIEKTEKDKNIVLLCVQCGQEFWYSNGNEKNNALNQDALLLSKIRKYSEDEVLANVVFRKIDGAGWIGKIASENGCHVCSFSNGSSMYVSKPSSSRATAICDAAAQLGRSGNFR